MEVEDHMVRIDNEEAEFHDKQPIVPGSDGEHGLGGSNYRISRVKIMEICTQHVLLKDNMYYFAAEEVYSENAEAFVMPHVLLTTPKSCMFSYITLTLIQASIHVSRSTTSNTCSNKNSFYKLRLLDVTRSNQNLRFADAPVSIRFTDLS
ncbi:unnamed protein product [Brassica rapa]|uniref:Uncharacterized protein n=2 Tax=Brassica TaxID=3705 RepID=A0A3P5ZW03_BRACM|nr:unnamed protein product [Brassica napus]CAG7885796.1 unnamed protein product [Brassica rapa]CDY32030.1 BnaA03g60340D [Brassica napus]VDC76188.1 unnamed protein product [Brassica rapa]